MQLKPSIAILALVGTAIAVGQIGRGIPGIKLPGLGDPFKKEPITTSLKDAKFEIKDQDGFTPPDPVKSLTTLQRTPTGGFTLQQGYYAATLQSY